MKTALRLIVLGLLALGAGVLCFFNAEAFGYLPWDGTRHFQFPTGVVSDSSRNLLVSDLGGRRLTFLDPQGSVIWQQSGGQRTGGFYTGLPSESSGPGAFYVWNSVQSQTTGASERVEILNAGTSGVEKKPLWVKTIPEADQAEFNRVPYFPRFRGPWMLYCVSDKHGGTELRKVSLASGEDTLVKLLPGIDAYNYVSADYDLDQGKFWFVDNFFKIHEFSLTEAGPKVLWDGSETGGSQVLIPSEFRYVQGSFFLMDGKGKVLRLQPPQGPQEVFTAREAQGEIYLTNYWVTDHQDLILTNETAQEVLVWSQGALTRRHQVSLGSGLMVWQWGIWLLALLGVAAFFGFLLVVYLGVMQRRTPLLLKQLGIFLPLIAGAVLGIGFWVFQDMMGRYKIEVETRLKVWSQLGAQMIKAQDIKDLGLGQRVQGQITESEAFTRAIAGLTQVVNGNKDKWNSAVVDYIYVPVGSDWYVFDQFTYFERYPSKAPLVKALETGEPLTASYQDAYSTWLSGFTPIKDDQGKIVAVLEVALDQNVFNEITSTFQAALAVALAIALAVLFLFAFVSTFVLLMSIRSLKQSAALISQGQYSVQVKIRSRDEIEDLGHVFNKMSHEIQNYVDQVIELNMANAKFVPTQFLTYLGKESITDIRLGDQVQKEMTVLFSDIRAFTSLSEKMTPEENFNFINNYLSEMGPRIRQQGGFIDKYIGDAIMALFPAKPEDGVRAALAMFEGLERLNRASVKTNIGVGLHTGNLMLGIIGETERFDGTVISDAVNLASRLESLTKYYGASILISGQALTKIPDPSFFQSRLLDRVMVKGKSESVDIHEILLPGFNAGLEKAASRGEFSQALDLYFRGDLTGAEKAFETLAQRYPEDRAPRIFLHRIRSFRPDQGTWTGVTVLDTK